MPGNPTMTDESPIMTRARAWKPVVAEGNERLAKVGRPDPPLGGEPPEIILPDLSGGADRQP